MERLGDVVRRICEQRFGMYTAEGANQAAMDGLERGTLDRRLGYDRHPAPYYHDCLKQYRDDWMRGYAEGYDDDGKPEF